VTERVIARCPTCGTQYTARGWPWLEALGNELRACAMPGCGPVYVVVRLPQAVKDSLCRETGYMDSVTDPVELRQAHDRFRSKVESIAAEAVTRYVHTRRQEELE